MKNFRGWVLGATVGAVAAAGSLSIAATAAASCAASDPYSSAVLADGPAAYYRLDEPSGPTVCDSARISPGTFLPAGLTFGIGGALNNSPDTAVGSTGGTGIGTGGPGLTGGGPFTLEGWFRRTGTAQDQALVDMGEAGKGNVAGLVVWNASNSYSGHCLEHRSALVLDLYEGVQCWDTAPTNLYDGQWHYLAITYDGTNVTGYVDGRALGSRAPGFAINLVSSPIRLGYWVDESFNKPLIGDEDEIAVYPNALSASKIQAHYQASGGYFQVVPRISCAGVCHVIRVRVYFETAGNVVAEQIEPGYEAARLASASAAARKAPKLIKSVSEQVSAGKSELKLKLTSTGAKKLSRAGKLKLSVFVTFKPTAGGNRRTSLLTLRLKKG